MNHGVSELIRQLRGGLVSKDMDRQLSALINAVENSGKKGTMTITLTVDPHGRDNKEMHVTAKCATKAPQDPDLNEAGVFFAVNGQLVRDNPEQSTLPGLAAVETADGSSPAEQQARRFGGGGGNA